MMSELLVERLGWTLVHSLWQGLIVVVAAALLQRLAARETARARYFLLCTAMAALPLMAVATFVQQSHPSATVQVVSTQSVKQASADATPVPDRMTLLVTPSHRFDERQILQTIVCCWLLGVIGFAIRNFCGWLWLIQRRDGRPIIELQPVLDRITDRLRMTRQVRLIESRWFDVPATIGVFRPIVFLPIGLLCDLTPTQIELILVHELAHVARYDYLVNLLQIAVESLMFYHPAVWWLSKQIRRERECCCDDVVDGYCNDVAAYVNALLELEQRRSKRLAIALSSTHSKLLERVWRLTRPEPARHGQQPHITIIATMLIAAVCLIVSMIVRAPAASPPTTTPTTEVSATEDLSQPVDRWKTVPIQPEDLRPEMGAYHIAPSDLISLEFQNYTTGKDDVLQRRVDSAGMVWLDSSGKNFVKVAGLTSSEAEKAVTDAYRHSTGGQGDVSIHLTITEVPGNTITIIGNVDKPGQYGINDSNSNLRQAMRLVAAQRASIDRIYVIRPVNGRQDRILKVDPEALFAGVADFNIAMHRGDTVYVAPILQVQTTQPARQATTTTLPVPMIGVLRGKSGESRTVVGGDHLTTPPSSGGPINLEFPESGPIIANTPATTEGSDASGRAGK